MDTGFIIVVSYNFLLTSLEFFPNTYISHLIAKRYMLFPLPLPRHTILFVS